MANVNPSDGDDSADMSITDTQVTIEVQSVDEGDVQFSRGERSITCHTTAEFTKTDAQEEDCGPHTSVSGEQLTTEGTQGRTVGVGSEELQEDDQHTSERSCVRHDPAILTTEDSKITDSETDGIEGYSAVGDVFEAAQSGNLAMIENYLDLGVPPDLVDEEGWSILHHAASHGQVEVIKLLHSRGCSVDPVDRQGRTPLHHAAASGECGSIGVLLELGSGVNSVDNEGKTPLTWSMMCKRYAAIVELLKYGGVCKQGDKPLGNMSRQVFEAALYVVDLLNLLNILFRSASTGDVQTVSAILDRGCPVDAVNRAGLTALHRAASGGHVDVVGVLVERGASVDARSSDGCTPLHLAASNGDLGVVSKLLGLTAQASITVVVGNYGTPPHQAAIKGHKEIVSVLLDAGCPIDVVDIEGRSALHYAAEGGAVEIIGVLIDRGLDVNRIDNEGITPLHVASACGKLEAVHELLRLGASASMTVVAGKGGTPLHAAAIKGHKEIVSVLLDAGCPIDVVNIEGHSALHYAAIGGAVEVIGVLIERGLDVNREDNDGLTPLHWASTYGKLETVRELLRLGANSSMTVVAGKGGTPLHQAAVMGHKEIVSVLLDAGCPIDVVDSGGGSALHYAAAGGAVEGIGVLIERGLDVSRVDNYGCTPLHAASLCGKLKAVRELLRLGAQASMSVLDVNYRTPLHLAAGKGHKEIVSVLLDAGCPIDEVNIYGHSALHYAAEGGAVDVIDILVERDLDVNRIDNKGITPLHLASGRGKLEAVHELLRLGANVSMTAWAAECLTPLHLAAVRGHKEMVSVLLDAGCPIDVVDRGGLNALHYAAVFGAVDIIAVLSEAMYSSEAHQPAGGEVQEMLVNKFQHGFTNSKNPLDCCSVAGHTPALLAAMAGSMEVLKLLASKHCDISIRSSFDLSIVEHAIMAGQMSKLIDMSQVFGVHTENTSELLPALQDRKLLDPNKLLILGSFAGDPLVIDTLSSEESVFTEAAHLKWSATRQFLLEHFQEVDEEKAIYDQLGLPNECPLSPLHISLILLKYKTEYKFKQIWIKALHSSRDHSELYIEKIISHPLTKFTVNELFPNALSPLDVARQFNLHDIACMIERAGGGPGMWADLPKEIKEKGISSLVSLKALLHDTGGQEAALRIISHLFGGLPSMTSAEDDTREKILQSKPELRHIVEHVLFGLHHLDCWFDVGILLGVEEDELLTIQSASKQDRVAYRTMLSTWLKHGRHVSWKYLLDVVGHFETKLTIDTITDIVVKEKAASEVRTDQTVMLSSLNTKPLVNASLVPPPCYEPTVRRPHPPLEYLSTVQQTPLAVCSLQDTAPSDAELVEVLEHVPVWVTLAVKLGVPIDTVLSLQHQTMGGLQALQHWRNGLSGEGYPTTWRFLLETVRKTQNLGPLVSDKLREEVCAKRTVCGSTRQYPHHVMSRPHPPLNPLSPGHVVPDTSSVEGDFEVHSPTELALLTVANEIGDDCFGLCIKLGVPISQASVLTADHPILGLNYWLSGRSGEGFPTTWRFLLDAVSSVCGRVVSSTLERQARRNPQWCSRRV